MTRARHWIAPAALAAGASVTELIPIAFGHPERSRWDWTLPYVLLHFFVIPAGALAGAVLAAWRLAFRHRTGGTTDVPPTMALLVVSLLNLVGFLFDPMASLLAWLARGG